MVEPQRNPQKIQKENHRFIGCHNSNIHPRLKSNSGAKNAKSEMSSLGEQSSTRYLAFTSHSDPATERRSRMTDFTTHIVKYRNFKSWIKYILRLVLLSLEIVKQILEIMNR